MCELGCERCGHNWYKKHYNNGNPTRYWNNYCGCCGGTNEQQRVCKIQCTGNEKYQNFVVYIYIYI